MKGRDESAPGPREVPEVLVEQYKLGELPPTRAATVQTALGAEPGGLARLAALEADDQATLALHPPGPVAAEVRRRLGPARGSSRAWLWLLPVAAVLLLFVLREPPPPTVAVGPGTERIKGSEAPRLEVHRRSEAGAEALTPDAPAAAGDLLQLTVHPMGAPYGVVVSLDGRGTVTLHHPAQPEASAALPAGSQTLVLPMAYELDDAPLFERFFLITADAPLDVPTVLEATRAVADQPTARLTLPSGVAQSDFVVRKLP
jgi:hypothetical protein